MFRASYPLLALLTLASTSACERVIDVGGVADASVERDASSDAAVDAFMPDPIFGPSATPEQVDKFARDISGRWYGIVTWGEEAEQVEFDFVPDEKRTQGDFYFVCTDAERCVPFGARLPGEGRYVLRHLQGVDGGVGAALGLLVWSDEHGKDQISFREMVLMREGEILSFRFDAAFTLDERTAVLVRTKPATTDDGGSGPVDGGGI